MWGLSLFSIYLLRSSILHNNTYLFLSCPHICIMKPPNQTDICQVCNSIIGSGVYETHKIRQRDLMRNFWLPRDGHIQLAHTLHLSLIHIFPIDLHVSQKTPHHRRVRLLWRFPRTWVCHWIEVSESY